MFVLEFYCIENANGTILIQASVSDWTQIYDWNNSVRPWWIKSLNFYRNEISISMFLFSMDSKYLYRNKFKIFVFKFSILFEFDLFWLNQKHFHITVILDFDLLYSSKKKPYNMFVSSENEYCRPACGQTVNENPIVFAYHCPFDSVWNKKTAKK